MRVKVSLKLVNAEGQYPSVVYDNVKAATYSADDNALVVVDWDNNKVGVIPWSNVLYVNYEAYDQPALRMVPSVPDATNEDIDPYILPPQPKDVSFAPQPEEGNGEDLPQSGA